MKSRWLWGLPVLVTPFYCTSAEVDEKIVVTATQTKQSWLNTPASVTKVNIDRQLPSLNIDAGDALEGVPGIQADNRYNYAQDSRLVVRGFGSRAAFGVRGLQLTVDGIPLSMPDGQAQTSSIILDRVQSIEVLRGPLAVIYGNAGGGVVEWQSRPPQTSKYTVASQLSANSLHRYRASAQYAGEQHQLRLIATDFQTDGPRPHNSAERQQQALRWSVNITNQQQLTFRYDNNKAPAIQDPSALTPTAWREDPEQTVQRAIDFNTRKSIHHRQGSLSWSLDSDTLQHQVAVWQGDRDIQQYLPFAGADPSSSGAVIQLSRQFEGAHAYSQWQPESTLALTAGLMTERQQDHRRGYVNDSGQKGALRRDEFSHITSDSLYLRANWTLADSWTLDAGARYNQLDYRVDDAYITPDSPDDSGQQSLSDISLAAALSWQITDQLMGYISYGEGFETPTLTELAYRNQGSGLNNQLGPATNRQWEAGVKASLTEQWRAALSVFDIRSNDEILVDQSNDGRTTYRNAGKTLRQGAELEINGQLAPTLSGVLSLTQLTATFDSGMLDGNQLPGVAEQQAYLRLDWSLPQQWQVQLSGRFRGKTFTADDNAIAAPSYSVYDVALRKEWNHGSNQLSTWVMIDNVTDKQYVGAVVVNQGSGRSFEPAVGRQLSVGLQWSRHF